MKVPMKALAHLASYPPNRSLCLLSLLEVLPATRRLCRPCHIASSGLSSPPLPVCITQAEVISTALLIWCLTRLSLSETFPQLFLRNAVWLAKLDEIKSATFIQIIQSWVWRWLLHKMVKPLLIDALGTTQIFQILFNLILAAVESQLTNSKTNSHNRNRRCPGAESSTNCCQRSASCVGFIPRTRMACPSRSAGTPDVWEKCANTASMEPMIWLNIMLSTLPTNKVPHRWIFVRVSSLGLEAWCILIYRLLRIIYSCFCDRINLVELPVLMENVSQAMKKNPWFLIIRFDCLASHHDPLQQNPPSNGLRENSNQKPWYEIFNGSCRFSL